jgi:hypothetical protein
MSGANQKDVRELEVFRAFVAAAQMPVALESIRHCPDPEPDVLCSFAGEDHYFELSEVFWEVPGQPGYTLAKGLHESEKAARLKSQLLAKGRTEQASAVETAGRFPYPPLLSLKQSLERKRTRTYSLHRRQCSLLLYYGRQSPFEPYDLLFECTDVLIRLLTGAAFDVVWIYHHSVSNSISLDIGTSGYGAMATGRPVPLSAFSIPEEIRAVVGRIALREGHLSMAFDAHYANTFSAVLKAAHSSMATA